MPTNNKIAFEMDRPTTPAHSSLGLIDHPYLLESLGCRIESMASPKNYQDFLDLACSIFVPFGVTEKSVHNTLFKPLSLINYSLVTKFGDQVIGGYLITTNNLFRMDQSLRGLKGEAIILNQDYRGLGIGSIMRAHPSKISGFDYVHGKAMAELDNLQNWLTRRILIGQDGFMNHTVEPFNIKALDNIIEVYEPKETREHFLDKYGFADNNYEDDQSKAPASLTPSDQFNP